MSSVEEARRCTAELRDILPQLEKKIEEGRVTLLWLEDSLVTFACDDPGPVLSTRLLLPMLRERLEAGAHEAASQKAAEAERALLEVRRPG